MKISIKKGWRLLAVTLALTLSGCQAGGAGSQAARSEAVESSPVQEVSVSEASSHTVENTEQKEKVMETPVFSYISVTGQEISIRLVSSLENVEGIVIYELEADSEYPGSGVSSLLAELTPDEVGEDGIISLSRTVAEGYQSRFRVDNSAVKVDYRCAGLRIGCYSGFDVVWSDFQAFELFIDTGNVNQRSASFWGDTACGAANGTLLLQSVLPLWGQKLSERLDAVRNYSAVSEDYSTGPSIQYCMSSTHILNSVNQYLEDNDLGEIRIKDFGGEGIDMPATVRELLDTGRPAAVMVAYENDAIVSTYRYGHWITVNGYRVTEEGGYEYHWENTLYSDYVDRWVAQEELEASFQEMANHLAEYAQDVTENPWGIDALAEPLVESFI